MNLPLNALIKTKCTVLLWVMIVMNPAVAAGQPSDSAAATAAFASPAALGLQTIPLPDASRAESHVQHQLRQRHQTLAETLVNLALMREQSAQAYLDLGEAYHAYEFFDAAEVCYRNAISLWPGRYRLYYYLGYLLQSVGRFEEALETYQKIPAGQVNPYLVAIRRGECYRQLNRLTEARHVFETALEIEPNGATVLARLGELALETKNYQEAVRLLEAALQVQPAANRLHYSLAMAYRGLKNREKAKAHLALRGKVGIQPPDPLRDRLEQLKGGSRVHILTGKSAYDAGRYSDAAQAFQKAVETDPQDAGAHINLGSALVQQQRFKEALTHFQAAAALEPANVTVHFNLGTLHAHLGDDQTAQMHMQKAVAAQPDDAGAQFELAEILRRQGRLADSLVHYRQAAQLDPDHVDSWLGGSAALALLERYAEVLSVLEQAHERLPHEQRITNALARLLAASPEADQRDGARALALASGMAAVATESRYAATLAMAYAETGQCDQAVSWQEKALTLIEPSDLDGQQQIAYQRYLAHYQNHKPCRLPLAKDLVQD